MADCESLAGCIFFNDKMASKPKTADMFKNRYCRGDQSGFARYMVLKALGKPKVPADLYPNDIERAKALIRQG